MSIENARLAGGGGDTMKRTATLFGRIGLLIVFCLVTAACQPVLSDAMREQADTAFPPGELHADPEKYAGKTILLGGTVVRVTNEADRSVLELLQRPLGHRLEPESGDETLGRALIVFDKTLDDQIFHPGRKITLAAEILGSETRPLDQTTYTYPLLRVREYHLWPITAGGYSESPQFHIGIGIFHGF